MERDPGEGRKNCHPQCNEKGGDGQNPSRPSRHQQMPWESEPSSVVATHHTRYQRLCEPLQVLPGKTSNTAQRTIAAIWTTWTSVSANCNRHLPVQEQSLSGIVWLLFKVHWHCLSQDSNITESDCKDEESLRTPRRAWSCCVRQRNKPDVSWVWKVRIKMELCTRHVESTLSASKRGSGACCPHHQRHSEARGLLWSTSGVPCYTSSWAWRQSCIPGVRQEAQNHVAGVAGNAVASNSQ